MAKEETPGEDQTRQGEAVHYSCRGLEVLYRRLEALYRWFEVLYMWFEVLYRWFEALSRRFEVLYMPGEGD